MKVYMKKFLILGIGSAQLDAIKFCKELGYTVYTCSNSRNKLGELYSDEFRLIDIANIEDVLKYAKDKKVDVIYSVGSDVAMPTVCYVSQKLRIPCFNSYEISKVCNSKNELRRAIGSENQYNVKFQTLDEITNNIEIEYPFVMKPVDSQGQRGVVLISDKEMFKKNFEVSLSYSRNRKVIIEEYVDGAEISVNTYFVEGNMVFFAISDRISWPMYDGGIIHKHIIPSQNLDEDAKDKVKDLVIYVINKLGIKNGPVYFQIKLKNNLPKLIEVTPRLDGCHLWRLLKYYTSINLLQITFQHLLEGNISANYFNFSKSKGIYQLEFICREPGSIVEDEDYSINSYLFFERYYNSGDVVKKINGLYEKIGYYIKTI